MSQFDDYFGRYGMPALQESHGRSVIYTALGRGPVPITGIVGPADAQSAQEQDGRVIANKLSVELALVDAPNASDQDTIGIDGETWIVSAVMTKGAGKVRLEITRPKKAEGVRRGYRVGRP